MGDLEKIVKNEGDVGLPNDQASGIMQRLEKQKDDLFNMLKNNPYRSGGPLDPQTWDLLELQQDKSYKN